MTPVPTGVWFFPELAAPTLVNAIAHADRIGLDGVWVGDEGPARDPFAVLAAAAMRTISIELGVGVTNPYLRHPGATAATMLTIHELSAGRAKLGLGAGGQMSLGPYRLVATDPLRAVEEAIRITRAVGAKRPTDGYEPPDIAVNEAAVGVPLPIFVGARSERLNRLASSFADGAFVAGMPPFRYAEVIGWARSKRPIPIELFPSVAFTDEALERHRPELIWALHDAPAAARHRFGLDREEVAIAADVLRAGDPRPARRLVNDDVLRELLLVGPPDAVGERLAGLVEVYRPSAIGLALLQDDLIGGIDMAAEAFEAMRRRLRAR